MNSIEDFLKGINSVKQTVKFEVQEKQILREIIIKHMSGAQEDGVGLPGKEGVRGFEPQRPRPVTYLLNWFKLKPAFAVIIILLVSTTLSLGTAWAAEHSLPGDRLYPFKINVVEKLSGYLALSAKSKAKVASQRALRRLNEAKRLRDANRLTKETAVWIEKEFTKSKVEFQAHIQELTNNGQAAIASETAENFVSSLKDYQAVQKELQPLAPSQDKAKSVITTAEAKPETVTHIMEPLPTVTLTVKNIVTARPSPVAKPTSPPATSTGTLYQSATTLFDNPTPALYIDSTTINAITATTRTTTYSLISSTAEILSLTASLQPAAEINLTATASLPVTAGVTTSSPPPPAMPASYTPITSTAVINFYLSPSSSLPALVASTSLQYNPAEILFLNK